MYEKSIGTKMDDLDLSLEALLQTYLVFLCKKSHVGHFLWFFCCQHGVYNSLVTLFTSCIKMQVRRRADIQMLTRADF